MGARQFDYYIFVDYSKDFIGYNIIELDKVKDLLNKISKIRHYKEVNHKNQYLKSIKINFNKIKIEDYFLALKIKKLTNTLEIFADIADFIKFHENSRIFISMDDKQSLNFERLVNILDKDKVLVVKEGRLRKDSMEHKLSLIIDNLLNIERMKNELQ